MIRLSALMAVLTLPLSTLADGPMPLSAMPKTYRAECGSCHVPYPPALMSASGWRTIMAGAHAHFGENSVPDEPVRREIETYLTEHAATSDRRFASRTNPPRLSSTSWFRRTHGRVKTWFANALVGSASNCAACHRLAEDERYAREEVALPSP